MMIMFRCDIFKINLNTFCCGSDIFNITIRDMHVKALLYLLSKWDEYQCLIISSMRIITDAIYVSIVDKFL